MRTVLLRYADEDYEHRFTDLSFEVGDALDKDGRRWVVTDVRERPHGLLVTLDAEPE
jgi:hypothetical protein